MSLKIPDTFLKQALSGLSSVKFMGVVNVTPDSFSDGGEYFNPEKAVQHAIDLLSQGANIVDIGGESTRPGAEPVPLEEELARTIPVIERIRSQIPDAVISIDTYKSDVARKAVEAGANWINDISGGTFSPDMFELAASYNVKIVISHIKGTPRDMQKNPYYDDVLDEVYRWLSSRAEEALRAGVPEENIIIDPGIGFGKRFEDNLALLWGIPKLKELGFPVLIGTSRKSFIGHYTDEKDPSKRDPGSFVTFVFAAMLGADILRVHDVSGAIQAVRIAKALIESGEKYIF